MISAIDGNYLIYDIVNHMSPQQDWIRHVAEVFVKRCFQQTIRFNNNFKKPKSVIQLIVLDGKAPQMKQKTQLKRRRIKQPPQILLTRQLLDKAENMKYFKTCVLQFIRSRESSCKFLITTILSFPDEPGEGEHKVLKIVRSLSQQPQQNIVFFSGDTDMIVLCLLNNYQNTWVQIMYRDYHNPVFEISKLRDILEKRYQTTIIPIFLSWLLLGNDFIMTFINFSNLEKQIKFEELIRRQPQFDTSDFGEISMFVLQLLRSEKGVPKNNEVSITKFLHCVKWCLHYFNEQYTFSKMHIVNTNPLEDIDLKIFKKECKQQLLDNTVVTKLANAVLSKIQYSSEPVYSVL